MLPATVAVTYKDGTTTRISLPAETWMNKSEVTWTGERPVATVVIDPDHKLPDSDRSNNMRSAK